MSKLTYSEPRQDWKGMWVVDVTREDGVTVKICKRTTKKAMMDWLKEEKNKGEK